MSEEKTSADLLAEVEQARQGVSDEARPDAVAKRGEAQAGTARERIRALLDNDSFLESGALVQPDRSNALSESLQAPADGLVCGSGRISAKPVYVLSQDYTVLGGSIGTVGDRKMCRIVDRAADNAKPLVMLLEGGGHRIQDGMNASHFSAASPVFAKLARLSGWVPTVAAIMGQGFAGPTAYAAMADLVIMIKGKSTMGMAGPALVKAGTGEDIEALELGGSRRQVNETGVADFAVESEEECMEFIQRYLSYLPANAGEQPPVEESNDPADRREDTLLELVPADARKVYDMTAVIELIADKDSVFELKPNYARNFITAFARLDGRPVGFIANQPKRKGGMLDAAACEKAAHFIAVCDAFGLPLVSLIDIPGLAIGPAAEDTGIGRRSGRLFYEMARATVPFVSIVLRKGYGGGYYAMGGGRGFNPNASFAWPTAEICAMSIEGAVDVAYRRKYESAENPQASRQGMIDDIRAQTNALNAASGYGIDDVIDPRDTRRHLIEIFSRSAPRRPDPNPRRLRTISPI
jgi:methylmalonyl-CoA decarboxylase subunit alpha